MRSQTCRNRLVAVVAGLVLAGAATAVPSSARAQEQTPAGAQVPAVSSVSQALERTLATARSAVDGSAVSGIAWYTDRATGKVVVTADSTVTAGALKRLTRTVGAAGVTDAVQVERTRGEFKPLLAKGDAIYGGGYRCSLGFNVRSGGTYYFLTAGHCAKDVGTWYTSAGQTTPIGPTVKSSFPGNDYGLVRYANQAVSHPGGFTAGTAHVGQSVTRDGSTTGVHSGTVQALDVSVRYQGSGTVRGLIQTDVCAESGDSGGPLYSGSTALGLTSGGSGDCTHGGTTFFQPVREALAAYGVSVY